MTILKVILTIFHVLVSIVLIVSILLQASKGGGLAGAFGGQASSTILGPRGAASALSSITQWLAGIFLALSLIISLMSGAGQQTGSITQKVLDTSPASQLPAVEDLNLGSPSTSEPVPATEGGQ